MQTCVAGTPGSLSSLLRIPGININYRNATGHTALMMAVGTGKKENVEMLLKHPGIDVNIVDLVSDAAFI
ncbi:ankyrin repeat domain-containing protein [archaeon]|nr:MAG: ankyrin repeat domain-containing protein [archaeon]